MRIYPVRTNLEARSNSVRICTWITGGWTNIPMTKSEIFTALQTLPGDGITITEVVEILALVEDAQTGKTASMEEIKKEGEECLNGTMTKSQIMAALKTLPEETTIDEVVQKLMFVEDLYRRIESINEENTVSHEEAKKILMERLGWKTWPEI